MPFAVNHGVRVFYDVVGDGPPLVLLHCNPFDHWVFVHQIADLSSEFHIIAPDLRGYGRTDKVTTPYKLADLEGDILAVLDQERIGPCILLGVSIGAVLALKLGHDHPQRFKALIAVGASAPAKDRGPDDPRVKAYLEQGIGAWRAHMEATVSPAYAASGEGRRMLDSFERRVPDMRAEAILRILQARAPEDLTPLLPAIQQPLLVINGAHDRALTDGRATAAAVPGARHAVLANAGHACCLEDPAGFNALVRGFLAGLALWPGA